MEEHERTEAEVAEDRRDEEEPKLRKLDSSDIDDLSGGSKPIELPEI